MTDDRPCATNQLPRSAARSKCGNRSKSKAASASRTGALTEVPPTWRAFLRCGGAASNASSALPIPRSPQEIRCRRLQDDSCRAECFAHHPSPAKGFCGCCGNIEATPDFSPAASRGGIGWPRGRVSCSAGCIPARGAVRTSSHLPERYPSPRPVMSRRKGYCAPRFR